MDPENNFRCIESVITVARALVKCADEFWPESPYVLADYLDALIDAIDCLGID